VVKPASGRTLRAPRLPAPEGPVETEINLNPGLILVRAASGRGLFDEPTRARYREALALVGVRLPVKGVRL
jgi:hypothetical protein